MTKEEKVARLRSLDPTKAKELLTTIVIDCIHDGHQRTSSEIMDGICSVLREEGLEE